VAFVSADLAQGVEWTCQGQAVEVIDIDSALYQTLTGGQTDLPPHPAAADDLAWIFYTSGTTGRPKGAMLSHRNLLTMTACYFTDVDQIAAQDCLLHAAPMSHGSGLYILPHVAAGAAQVIPESGGFDVAEIVGLLDHHRGMSFFAAPTMVHRLTLAPDIAQARLENLKTIIYGGAPMYQQDLLRAQEILGPCLAQIYGQGESPMTITALSKALHTQALSEQNFAHLNSAGIPHTLAEVAIAGPDGALLGPDQQGEILVRGDAVMVGYWNDPDATAKALRDGWLYTGDMGSLDAAGYLTLKDRSKDVIISGGSNIYPREVEEVLLTHPEVREVSVIGTPDPDWGEVVTAYVVGTASPESLDSLCLSQIARFKRPKSYRFLDSLPKNAYGKVLKTSLRTLDTP
jgi:long-chain acyl-CoA synthetase